MGCSLTARCTILSHKVGFVVRLAGPSRGLHDLQAWRLFRSFTVSPAVLPQGLKPLARQGVFNEWAQKRSRHDGFRFP